MTTLYTFDRSTKYWLFTGVVEQQLDAISGDPIPLRNATHKKVIKEKVGHVRGFVSGKWKHYVDHRGTEYWHEDGTKHSITEVGEAVPEGALLEAPVILPTDEELAAAARAKRDTLLNDMSWRYERHAGETRLGLPTTDAIEALDEYAQALRNITNKTKFPKKIKWPKIPA
ncbi:phage tail assembly chaperone [Marinomonas transparens]|uniref:Phage tail assembly chaperone-like domain-containing protein n=1 Tax=Marinomonas transparens TaxID=2795388 RepID=A0A934JJB8_9GAMM|nr:phage tail assembly chaperone [Marinomonas transparens]MBJ7537150.1 hypothetical protein [Marinomonas transparens]